VSHALLALAGGIEDDLNIRAASKETAEFCGSPGWKDFYYAEMDQTWKGAPCASAWWV
jgi:hypothetical protein